MPQNREEDLNAHLSGAMTEQDSGSTSWFKRGKKGINTSTAEKKEAPDGLWTLCPNCKYTCTNTELRQNLSVCPKCQHHHRIGSAEYFDFLFDNQEFTEMFAEVKSVDFLGFNDLKSYKKRLDEAYSKTGLNDSISSAQGKVGGHDLVICCMDFNFIGGSLGSVMGEKIARAADYCLANRIQDLPVGSNVGKKALVRQLQKRRKLLMVCGPCARIASIPVPIQSCVRTFPFVQNANITTELAVPNILISCLIIKSLQSCLLK